MKSWLRLPLFCCIAVTFSWASAFPQSSPDAPQPATLTLPFFVTDEDNHPVVGITQADLSAVGDEKVPLTVVAVRNASELPLRLGLLIDTSNSQKFSSSYAEATQKIQDFLLAALKGPDDKAFIMTVSDLSRSSEFLTRDQIPLVRISTQPQGGTALYDAIVFAGNRFMKDDPGKPTRRVLVLLTDGDDDASEATRDVAVVAAQVARVAIFSLDTNETHDDQRGARALKEFSSKTGGASINLRDHGVKQTLAEVDDQIGNMYGITFTASSGEANRHHRFELKPLPGKKLKIRTPQGYYIR